MKSNRYLIIMLAGLAMIGISPGQALAGGYGHGQNFCSQTARTVFHACHFDVLDDFNQTKANCINIDDDDAREECFGDAWEAKREDWRGCRDQKRARLGVCDLIGEDRYADPLQDPGKMFVDLDEADEPEVPNQYVSLAVGHTYVLRAGNSDPESDEYFEETVIVHVTDDVREVEREEADPVKCRVVVDAVIVYEEDEDDGTFEWVVDELTDDYFAQELGVTPDVGGDVYYCGEISRNYEDDYLDNLDGSFFSGVEYARAGVLTRQYPLVGQVDRQEYAIAEAEDLVEYVDLMAVPGVDEGGQNPNSMEFECAGVEEGDCLKTFDSSALDPESTEFKYYKADVGFVLAVSFEDGEFDGEREELVCVGDEISVLYSADCNLGGKDAVDDLLDKLCELSPDAFCVEED